MEFFVDLAYGTSIREEFPVDAKDGMAHTFRLIDLDHRNAVMFITWASI